MKETVTLTSFRDRFYRIRPDSFSYEGLEALFDYLENLEDESGVESELDIIGIDCSFCEYDSMKSLRGDYSESDIRELFILRIQETDRVIVNN